MKSESKEIKESILAQLETMNAEDLKKVLGFLEELEKQKKEEREAD